MRKVLVIFFLFSVFCNISIAENYYFKECKFSESHSGSYIIDIENVESLSEDNYVVALV